MPISPYSVSPLYGGKSLYSSSYSSNDTDAGGKLYSSSSSKTDKPIISAPRFLSGNTAALSKTFTGVKGVTDSAMVLGDKNSPTRRYLGIAAKKDDLGVKTKFGKGSTDYVRPSKYDASSYTSRYANCIQAKMSESRPKEISISGKPPPRPFAHNLSGDITRHDDTGFISRNRQVVRLTIKRDKHPTNPSIFNDSPVKTVAQKLLEKYTIKERKVEDPLLYVPKNKWAATNSIQPSAVIGSKPPKSSERLRKTSCASIDLEDETPLTLLSGSHAVIDDDDQTSQDLKSKTIEKLRKIKSEAAGNEGDDELSSSDDEENDDDKATTLFARATRAASHSHELENAEEVKDAIIAAILHPGIDIESDEEIKKLVNDEELSERKSSSKRKSSNDKKKILVKRKKSDVEIGGEIIVDKLKRFVKQQVSTKKESLKKKRSNKNSVKEIRTSRSSLVTGEKNESANSNKKEPIVPIVLQDDENIKQIETDSPSKRGDQVSKSNAIANDSYETEMLSASASQNDPKLKTPDDNQTPTGREGNSTKEKVALKGKKNIKDKKTDHTNKAGVNLSAKKITSHTDGDSLQTEILPSDEKNSSTDIDNQVLSETKNEKLYKKDATQVSIEKELNVSSPEKNTECTSKKDKIDLNLKTKTYSGVKNEPDCRNKTAINDAPSALFDSECNAYKSQKDFKLDLEKSSDRAKNSQLQNSFEVKKSPTAQTSSFKDDFSANKKYFSDTESIAFDEAPDMKPSLLQFLQDSKTEVKSISQVEEEKNKKALDKSDNVNKVGKTEELTEKKEINEKISDKEETKKAMKRPRQINLAGTENKTEEKPVVEEAVNLRKILKRPVKIVKKEEDKNEKPTETPKPKKIWKKPAPPPPPEIEFKNALGGLKNPKLRPLVNNSTATVIKKKQTKETSENNEPESVDETPDKKSSKLLTVEINKPLIKGLNNTKLVKKVQEKDKLIPKDVKSSSKTNSLSPTKNDLIDEGFPNDNGLKKSETSTSALSTSLSADSAYGSSPSTPQPRVHELSERIQIQEETKEESEITDKCEMCGTNCHKKCEKQMPNLCGVNQKLLAEALSSVKKGSSPDAVRTLNVAGASNTKSVSSLSSEAETTTTDEDETDTDSSEYNGPAEIRSPIQTRPKFKKYNLQDFNFIKVLGKGSFGKVMLAQQVNTENYFAVKCLKKDVVLEDNDVECCLIERKVLTLGTKHPYLCHLFCSFQTPSHLFFVMEYLTGGDLMFHIQHVGRFDEYRACFYGAEIVSGLKFLHNKGIIYRDLKLDNILLDYEGHIRIADFGMCKLQIYLDRFADTFCGTPDYMAPEVIKGQHYNQCVDWWSFGVLLYEMMIGKSPFKGCDEDHLFWLICNEEPFYPRFLSREAQSILKQLLDKDGSKRLGPPYCFYGEIKCHPFFKYIDWGKIERKEVETPYKPRLRHILDVQYFDRLFTKRNAALTPLDTSILETMDQTPFKEFSYTNPNITD